MVMSKTELGKLIKEARNFKSKQIGKKFTGQMLANEVGISRSYIGDIESGRTYPSFVLLGKIAEACDVSLDFFQDENQLNNDIDNFVKMQMQDISEDELIATREAIKQDPDSKPNHIYEYLDSHPNNMVREDSYSNLYNYEFKTAEAAVKFLLKQPALAAYGGYDVNNMTDDEIIEFANELLNQLKLLGYKYKK
ncbi:MAG: helix-turn-helix domain-containing protein [Clostridiaceae bacterium]